MKQKKNQSVLDQTEPKGSVEQKRHPVAAICSALGTAVLIILIALCIPLVAPKVAGYQVYTVISGSMEPAIPVGSLVYVKSESPQDVEAQDVIAFYGGQGANALITHRVLENHVVMGEFITKGDANDSADMNPVSYSDYVGTVERTIPKLGIFAQFASDLQGKLAAACLIAVALILHVVAAILRRN